MILDAAGLAPDQTLTADVCIVGGGAAGVTLALELRGTGLDVILLEAGGRELSEEDQAQYAAEMIGLGTWSPGGWRLRHLGGTTNHWAGWCRPLRPRDFEVRDWMPHSGWPIGWADVEPFYARAAELVELETADFDAAKVDPDRPQLASDDGIVCTEMFLFSPPTRFGQRYGAELDRATDVRVYLHANVVDIQLDDASGEVTHVRCTTLDGLGFRVEAARFVLAAGGLENPRLLLAANSQRPNGVANDTDQVGRWFMEHPHYRSSAAMVSEWALDDALYQTHRHEIVDARGSRIQRQRATLALSEAVREAEQLPDWTALLNEAIPEDSGIGPLSPKDIGTSLFRCAGESRFYWLTFRTEQRPIPDSRVVLHPSDRDQLGMPRIQLDWRIAEEDGRALVRGMEIFGAWLGARCLGRLWIPHVDGSIGAELSPGGHHMGTTRMGDDPDTSVVDGDGRCHEVPNLYIAGSSVFTTGSSANPTLTIVALAVRLARHLAATR